MNQLAGENTDDKETNLHAIRTIVTFIEKWEKSDMIHDGDGKIKRVVHDTQEELYRFKQRPSAKSDWSGGREKDDDEE